jgi:hypothetical protein
MDIHIDTNCLLFAADYIQRQKDGSLGVLPEEYLTTCEHVVDFLDWCVSKTHGLHTLQFSYVQMLHTLQLDEYYKKQMLMKTKLRDILDLKQAFTVLEPSDVETVRLNMEGLTSSWPYTLTWHPVPSDFPKWTGGFWSLAKVMLETTHMDAEDALHLSSALMTDCSHILTGDKLFRSSADKLKQLLSFRMAVAPLIGKAKPEEVKFQILSASSAYRMTLR